MVSDQMAAEFEPPEDRLVNHRWIPAHTAEWVEQADAIMLDHGAVKGTSVYRQRHQARWRAQKLIRLMVDLGLHERWELKEHVDPRDGGWIWTVEYVGGES